MISCQDADVLAAALSVGSIDRTDDATLQLHLASCADCRRLAAEYMEAAARLPLALEPLQPSPELRSRLMKAVYAEAAAAADQASAGEQGPWWRRVWARVPAGRGFTVLAGAAAVAVVAVSAWALAGRQPSLQRSASVAVGGMPAAPGAHGQLVMDRADGQAVLTVTGLPGPPQVAGGSGVYEVWLIPAGGSPVPAAFLTRAPDGTWTAAIHGDVGSYATLAATAEPPGGSSAPTGPRVLEASLTGA
ncbi:MAG TPA: anti-sigma factor [Candidatus Dormibacteraeota bacterium]|nr:anti-sigma factor [Candidatus Dormibacteraeota bacterium]